MDRVWIRTHVSSGDVTVHSEPPRPHKDGMREEKTFNRDGEEITNYFNADGSCQYAWVEVPVYK